MSRQTPFAQVLYASEEIQYSHTGGYVKHFNGTVRNGILTAAILFFSLNSYAQSAKNSYEVPVSNTEIKIGSYNAENLFDNLDDADKDDATFLPRNHPNKERGCENESNDHYKEVCLKTDWTDHNIEMKFFQIRRALSAMGTLPDALVLVEMENMNIARALARYLGYNDVRISEGPDRRGIDVVIMWRNEKLKYVDSTQTEVPGVRTRPILKVLFQVRAAQANRVGANLVVYANHWPAQLNPDPQQRMAAAKTLARNIEQDAKTIGKDFYAVAMGDFNTTPEERPNALNDIILNSRWEHALYDVHSLSDESNNPMKRTMAPGTHYFPEEKKWRRFDKILVTKNLADGNGFDVVPETFRVNSPEFLTKMENGIRVPWRYNFFATHPNEAGYSDHFGISVKLNLPD